MDETAPENRAHIELNSAQFSILVLTLRGLPSYAIADAMQMPIEDIRAEAKTINLFESEMRPYGSVIVADASFITPSSEVLNPDLTEEKPLGVTPSQLKIMNLVAQGYKNKKIAEALDISFNTVTTQIVTVLNILGVKNRTQAALRLLPFLDSSEQEQS